MSQKTDRFRVNLPVHKAGLPYEEMACLAQVQSGVFSENKLLPYREGAPYQFYFWNIHEFALV